VAADLLVLAEPDEDPDPEANVIRLHSNWEILRP